MCLGAAGGLSASPPCYFEEEQVGGNGEKAIFRHIFYARKWDLLLFAFLFTDGLTIRGPRWCAMRTRPAIGDAPWAIVVCILIGLKRDASLYKRPPEARQ